MIKAELDVHADVEEVIFYPNLMEKGDKELKKRSGKGNSRQDDDSAKIEAKAAAARR